MVHDQDSLQRRLAKLGRRNSAPSMSRPEASARPPGEAARGLPPGELIETDLGVAYCIESRYALGHRHGPRRLEDLLSFEPKIAAEVARHPGLERIPLDKLAFLDTETTGLAGGAGTLVFLVGLGLFEDDQFVLRQYFLRDPEEEQGMLSALKGGLERAEGFVTFNGRAFDVPLLEMRFVLGLRQRWNLSSWPHLDLLFPSRRLWRRALPDCRLGTLERSVLGLSRAQADVPGSEIPALYLDYLRTGDASQMSRIVYHNAVDVLSLVGLATQVLLRHHETDPQSLSPAEALAVARWHESSGRKRRAEAAYLAVVGRGNDDSLRIEALRRLSLQLKRQGRHGEAVSAWEGWHKLAPDDPRPCVELAKYYEWQAADLEQAFHWGKAALVSLSHWTSGWRRDVAWGEVQHRLARLARKIA